MQGWFAEDVFHTKLDSTQVKRLMKDPPELCCPLSHQLMDDPVVAADGMTYDRAWVEECFKRQPGKSPMTGEPVKTMVPRQENLQASRPLFDESLCTKELRLFLG